MSLIPLEDQRSRKRQRSAYEDLPAEMASNEHKWIQASRMKDGRGKSGINKRRLRLDREIAIHDKMIRQRKELDLQIMQSCAKIVSLTLNSICTDSRFVCRLFSPSLFRRIKMNSGCRLQPAQTMASLSKTKVPAVFVLGSGACSPTSPPHGTG